jgi:PAS domain S-box-containing protein
MMRDLMRASDAERFADLKRLSREWLWETDATGRFTYFSADATHGGINLAALVGQTWRDCGKGDAEQDANLAGLEAKLHRREAFDNVILPAATSGPSRWCAWSGEPRFDVEGSFVGYRGIGRDVTEARDDAASLTRLTVLVDAIFSTLPGGLAVFDKDQRLVACNELYPRTIGVDPSLVRAGVSVRDMLVAMAKAGEFGPCEDPEAMADRGLAATKMNPTLFVEHMRPNGRAYEMRRARMADGGSVSIYLDITKRRRAALQLQELNVALERRVEERTAALAESERFQRALIASVPGMVYRRTLDPGGRLRFASDACRGLLGRPPEALTGESSCFTDLIHGEDREHVLRSTQAAVAAGRPFELEYRLRHADGGWRWVLDRGQPLSPSNGEPPELEGLILDMSDRKAAEQAQIKLEEQLREALKMDAIGRLTGGLAHDLNNYLSIIMGNLDLLDNRQHADPKVPQLIAKALSGALRGAELTRSLLAFSRRQPLAPKVIDLGDRVGELVKLLKRTIGEQIVVDLDVDPNLWPVKIDGAQLDTCIVNLANNARDAMPKGGRLSITLRNVPAGTPGGPDSESVLIKVGDTGTGMDADTLAKAFEPFFTTKGPGHGTGLGLSMVHGFVHQSLGVIRLESTQGAGTEVQIHLPRAALAGPAIAEPGSMALPGGSETILIVEDNEQMRATVKDQLSGLGYRVVEMPSGDAAHAWLMENQAKCDLVFSDILMPGDIDGIELARRVRTQWPQLNVLLTSGFPRGLAEEIDLDATKAGTALLRKPYRLVELARAIRSALAA